MISKPKFKICRRLGPGVYDKCQTSKFTTATGKSGSLGARRPKALSEYGAQLIEKQKIRFSYGISERQLSNYVKKASHVKGAGTTEKFYEELESRLDNAIYRMGLGSSRRATRQMVSHGHFIVNDKKIFNNIAEKLKDYNFPAWISFDLEKMEGKVLAKPKNTESFLDLNAVLEFYSR